MRNRDDEWCRGTLTHETIGLTRRSTIAAMALAPWAALAQSDGSASTYPVRTVRIIVPFAAGGAIDLVGRSVGEGLSKATGQTFVVENRTGASGNIGVEAAVRAAPDGYTLLVAPDTNFTVNPVLFKLAYDPLKDLVPLAKLVRLVLVLAVHESVPVYTLQEFITYSRSQPQPLSCGTPGTGTPHDLALTQLEQAASIKLTHVPYKGGAPAVSDAVAGHLQTVVGGLNAVKPFAASGKLRIIAVMQEGRSQLDPSLPAVSEALPGFDVSSWLGLFVPAGTPTRVVEQLRRESLIVMTDKTVVDRLGEQGIEVLLTQPSNFAGEIRAQLNRNAVLARNGVIKAE